MATTDRIGPASDEPAAGTLRWETAFSLATNRFTIYDMLKVIGITWAIMLVIFGTIFAVNDGAASFWPFFTVLGSIMVGFLLMFMAIMLFFYGNRYPARFTLSPAGALVESRSRRAHLANRAAVVAGALGGRPGVAGAGLIAGSQEAVSIAWKDVKRVNEHPDQRVISLMNGWRVVIRLYCAPENYGAARDFIRAHAKGGCMIEMLRRLLLAAGLASAIVLAMYTPPSLLRAFFVDFARDYDDYGKGGWPGHVAESLIEKPATLDLYIEEKVGNRRVDVTGDAFESFLSRLKAAAASHAEASSTTNQTASGPDFYLRPGDPPLDRLSAAFQASREAGWLNTYVAVATPAGREFFEVLVVTEPRDSTAPPSMVHPFRPYAWWALLAGLGAYLLLPRTARRRERTATYDPVGSVLPPDGLGALWLSVCVFVPLWATDTLAEALGEEFGLTVFFGLLALLALPAFISSARKAAFSITAEPDSLVLTSVSGRRTVRLGEIVSVDDLLAGKLKSGVVLRLVNNDAIKLDWTDLERFEVVLGVLRRSVASRQ